MNALMTRLAMTVPAVAQTPRVSRGAADEAVHTGQIPAIRIGHTLRVAHHALAGLLAASDGDAGIAVLMAYWVMRQDDEGALSLTDSLKLVEGGCA